MSMTKIEMERRSDEYVHVEHGFGPCYDANSRMLFLGTMASPASRNAGFFYMHPQNRFWPAMDALFSNPNDPTDHPGTSADSRRAFALRHHFALWDTIESCDIIGASDASITNVVPSDLTTIIRNSKITHIYPTGKKASELYRKYCEQAIKDAGLDVTVIDLPSTSSAYASKTRDQIIAMFKERVVVPPECRQ